MIGRYPRYRELWERYRATCDRPEGPEAYFVTRDYADLQVLSQLAWFDEYFLEEPDIAALVQKGEDFSRDDQQLVIAKEREDSGQGAARLCRRRRGADRSSFPPRRTIIPFCRCCATPTLASNPRPG